MDNISVFKLSSALQRTKKPFFNRPNFWYTKNWVFLCIFYIVSLPLGAKIWKATVLTKAYG